MCVPKVEGGSHCIKPSARDGQQAVAHCSGFCHLWYTVGPQSRQDHFAYTVPLYSPLEANRIPFVKQKGPCFARHDKEASRGYILDNLLEIRTACIFILAFAGFFNIKEVLHIKYKPFHDRYTTINIDVNKTNQLSKENQESVNSTNICPIRILRRYLSRLKRLL